MADNMNVTAGTGTVIATDQVGTAHYQKIKLFDGTADSSTGVYAGGGVEANALRVTLANDSSGILEVIQDTAADFNCTEANSAAIKAAVELIDNAISGTEMQVDVVAALPAGDNNIGNVDIASSVALDVSAATVTVDLGANNDVVCAGDIAHDAVDSGNPIKIGAKAKNMDGTAPGTAVAEDDRANLLCDVYGRLFVENIHPNFSDAKDNQVAAQTNTVLVAAPGAGLSIYITDIIMSTDTAGNIKLVEDTGGTPADVKGPYYFAANGGIAVSFKTPVKITSNKNLGYTSTMAGNHTVEVHYFVAP